MEESDWIEKLKLLSGFKERAKKLGKDLFKSSPQIYLMDTHTMAAINRSMCLVEGFIELAFKNNFIAAIPFIRLQIDTCLRYYLSLIVEDRNDFIEYFNKGLKISEYKPNRFKKQFTDTNLASLLNESFPGFLALHSESSKFVHFTSIHSYAIIESVENDIVRFRVGNYDIYNNIQKCDFIDNMINVTDIFIELVETWIEQKTN